MTGFAHLDGAWLSGRAFWAPPGSVDASVRDRPILETLAEIVQCHGDRPAVQDAHRTLSFNDLWTLTARIAAGIAAAAVQPAPVAIVMPADATYFPAFLACLAVGRPCVLLDATAPAARNQALLRQIGVRLALTDADAAAPAGLGDVARLAVGPDMRAGTGTFPGCPPGFDVDAPALILCTSGSTGHPKAVVHSQRTIMQRAWSHACAIGVAADDVCLSLSPPATLGGINGLLTFAVAGAATCLLDLRDCGLSGLLDRLRTGPVTSLRAPPSILRILSALPAAPPALSGLRNVTTYGEAVLRADTAALRACMPPAATIFAAYGSTESGGMGWYPSAEDAFDAARTPAGRLMPGIDGIILDPDGQPCPPGIDGELVVRSRYNALGVWQDGRCVPGPLTPDPADPALRVHRTGDVARRSADGVFLVAGRRDRMIKVNGQRVEPAEIEAAIRLLPEIAACAVVSQARGQGVAVSAYVVLAPGVQPAVLNGLGALLRSLLPDPMVPSRFIAIAALPLLPGGKVDYPRLSGAA